MCCNKAVDLKCFLLKETEPLNQFQAGGDLNRSGGVIKVQKSAGWRDFAKYLGSILF